MQHGILNTMGIFIVASSFLIGAAQNTKAQRCSRLSAALTGLNYHRSDRDSLNAGEIWRFGKKGQLRAFVSGAGGLEKAQKLFDALWAIESEDGRCALKITSLKQPPRTTTFRIVDTTWAIVTSKGVDKHIPDFEDHSGMKTRFCGVGDHCDKLWK